MAQAKSKENEYEDIPGTFVFNAERSRQGYGINMFCMSLMKDENRKAFKANEAGVPEEVSAHPRADRRDPQARLQPHARARRQHLLHRQARRDRRALVPPPRRRDDRLHAGRLRRDDAGRRPLGGRQPVEVRQDDKPAKEDRRQGARSRKAQSQIQILRRSGSDPWRKSSQEFHRRTCRPSAPRSTTSRPRSRTGSGCSPASRNPSNGWPRRSPTS